MKYPINNYVLAFTELLRESPDKEIQITEKFVKLLEKTGDIKYSGKILEAIHKKLVNSDGGKWVTIETVRKIAESKSKLIEHDFSGKDHLSYSINPELIAGVRITMDGEKELNNSLRNKLNKLFR